MLAFKFVQAKYDKDQDLIRRLKNSFVGGWTREQLEVTPFKVYTLLFSGFFRGYDTI